MAKNPKQHYQNSEELRFDINHRDADLEDNQVIEQQRNRLLRSIAAGNLGTLHERIAWILNHYPETRDSDVKLQLQYWDNFEGYDGGMISPDDLFRFTRLTSIARARAKLQNEYKLFLANIEVRKHRGTLSENEREKAIEQKPEYPVFVVYADESGKTADHLIVGSMWFLHGPETLKLFREIADWRESTGYKKEFHFKELDDSNFERYVEFSNLIIDSACTISFKAISVERRGHTRIDQAINDLYYHLIIRGIEHEINTGRGPLPRSLMLWKDLEEIGRDKLMLANLKDRLLHAGKVQFKGELNVDLLEAINSEKQPLIQMADLFTSSNNRILNATGTRNGPKDKFADYLLRKLNMPAGPSSEDHMQDMTVHLKL